MAVTKIAVELRTQMNVLANQERVPIIVRHKEGVFSAQAVLPSSPRIEYKYDLFPGEALEATPADIETLSRQEDVEQIWPDLPVHTWLDLSVPKIEAPKVWNAGLKGTGIKIAVVDTGIDDTHPDFAGRIAAGRSFVSDTTGDDNGHGTHVAGIVAGSGAASGGTYAGVAPEANLYVAKVLRADGGGSMSGVMAGIEWAVLDQKVQIINLSLGGPGPCDGTDALSTLCDEAVRRAGVVICVAGGNSGPDARTVGPPGCAHFVITVGATNDDDQVAAFSSRGPTSDGRIKPDLVFPGVNIVAPRANGTGIGDIVAEGYVSSSGTSMATPHASGVAALMLQANPDLPAEQVKMRMTAGAVNIGASPNEQGAGRVNAYQAYLEATEQVPEPTPPPPPSQEEPPGCLAGLFKRGK